MAIIRALSSSLLWAIVWGCVPLDVAHGLPQFIVSSGKAKCVSVEVPRETMVKIHYEAPGTNVACHAVMLSCGDRTYAICNTYCWRIDLMRSPNSSSFDPLSVSHVFSHVPTKSSLSIVWRLINQSITQKILTQTSTRGNTLHPI